jgi:hypothetical protein
VLPVKEVEQVPEPLAMPGASHDGFDG